MERLNTVAQPGQVGRLTLQQIAQISTWATVPDQSVQAAAMHQIRQVPANFSTTTYVNPMDPGDGPDTDWHDNPDKAWGTVIPAGRLL